MEEREREIPLTDKARRRERGLAPRQFVDPRRW
jgi:hypothetical protein